MACDIGGFSLTRTPTPFGVITKDVSFFGSMDNQVFLSRLLAPLKAYFFLLVSPVAAPSCQKKQDRQCYNL
jgi:hypothetical protein